MSYFTELGRGTRTQINSKALEVLQITEDLRDELKLLLLQEDDNNKKELLEIIQELDERKADEVRVSSGPPDRVGRGVRGRSPAGDRFDPGHLLQPPRDGQRAALGDSRHCVRQADHFRPGVHTPDRRGNR